MTATRTHVDVDALTPKALASLDDAEMRVVVNVDLLRSASNRAIRTDPPEWIADALRGPLVERWLTALRQMLANVDAQLELLASEHNEAMARGVNAEKERARYFRARSKPQRFRAALLEALPEAERLCEGRVWLLETTIRAHRNLTTEPTDADRVLWAVLDD